MCLLDLICGAGGLYSPAPQNTLFMVYMLLLMIQMFVRKKNINIKAKVKAIKKNMKIKIKDKTEKDPTQKLTGPGSPPHKKRKTAPP